MDHDTVRNFRSSSNLISKSSSDALAVNAKYDLKVKIPATRVLVGDFSTLVASQDLNIRNLLPLLFCC
ncbi:hypothetical protein Lalb_Chr01g0011911 [Lupinus albus]|uniref:Uncharacterized protein n=1 Tax=Lupinus albus TaxID=3870 RepID=A0A6A4R2U3_LUPAL|nr:hypothetical protein Lalb_Chr01g0011911 [Lupinus albus]